MSPAIEFEKSEFIKNVWNKRAQIYHRQNPGIST